MRDLPTWISETLPKILVNTLARSRRMRARGIPFIVLLVPDSASIYPEFLPRGCHLELPGAAEILADKLSQLGVDVICPAAELRDAKSKFEVFLRHDTHWTVGGAHICYIELMERIRQYLPVETLNPDALHFGTRIGFGDLGIYTRPERKGVIQTVEIPDYPVQIVKSTNDQRVKSFRHVLSAHGQKRLLMFRDSAANALLPFLERSFAETIAISPSPQVLDDAIDKFSPDIVVMELGEMGLFLPEFAFADWGQRSFEQVYDEPADDGVACQLYHETIGHIEGGRKVEALAAAATALLHDRSSPYVNNLAWTLLNAEQYQHCRSVVVETADANHDRFLHYLHSTAASVLGRFPEAMQALSKAIEIQPKNAQYLYSCAEMNYQQGLYHEALAAIERSILGAPLYERSWVIAISALLQIGDTEAATIRQRQADEIFGPGKIVPDPVET